ncbi:PhnE/PtxC family ABC transporter permease [Vagococcus elongatus]|uniref:Phosphonate ABC transporter permease n=1 Tax=Vagococcus elongatus TaxID=180344 RepID=A0A430B5Z1_9ENTE|nr:ABC transporter permease subunit [Vagococcus elongatus]RSU15714.1 phosphonate ABC transporter permease [Vagococcus elongatus]
MERKIQLTDSKSLLRKILMGAGSLVLFSASVLLLNLDLATFVSRAKEAGSVLQHFLQLDLTDLAEIMSELFLSVTIAFAALIGGTLFSLIFAVFGAENITPHRYLSYFIKGFISIIRAIPSLVWILMIVASMGFGTISGLIGLIFPTVGYLGKSFISSIEEVPEDVIEAMKATGASKIQIITEGVFPCVSNMFLSWIAIRVESNVAESISLGIVGAGGIGTLLTRAIGSYDYPKISTIILMIFVTMLALEIVVNRIKTVTK